MLLHRYHLRNRGLKDANIAREAQASVFGRARVRPRWKVSPYPFSNPPKARPSNATGRLGAKPNISMLSAVPASPVIKTGFRPTRSLSLPQITPVENSANAKAEVTMPAYIAIWRLSSVILKDEIM